MECHLVAPSEQAAWHSHVDDRRVLSGIFWSYAPVLRGAICPNPMVPAPFAIIASFVGDRLACGTGSWMHWLLEILGTMTVPILMSHDHILLRSKSLLVHSSNTEMNSAAKIPAT
jgi:hypothetical protein